MKRVGNWNGSKIAPEYVRGSLQVSERQRINNLEFMRLTALNHTGPIDVRDVGFHITEDPEDAARNGLGRDSLWVGNARPGLSDVNRSFAYIIARTASAAAMQVDPYVYLGHVTHWVVQGPEVLSFFEFFFVRDSHQGPHRPGSHYFIGPFVEDASWERQFSGYSAMIKYAETLTRLWGCEFRIREVNREDADGVRDRALAVCQADVISVRMPHWDG